MDWFLGVAYALIGLALVFWAAPISVRYNGWTTRLRERHPNFNPPPTPEWRARNTRIMTIMFRIVGAFFIVLSVLNFIANNERKLCGICLAIPTYPPSVDHFRFDLLSVSVEDLRQLVRPLACS